MEVGAAKASLGRLLEQPPNSALQPTSSPRLSLYVSKSRSNLMIFINHKETDAALAKTWVEFLRFAI